MLYLVIQDHLIEIVVDNPMDLTPQGYDYKVYDI